MALRKDFSSLLPLIRNVASRSLFYLGKNQVAISIYLVPLATIAKLNRTYRDKNKPTNVLSFQMPKDFILPKMKFCPIGEIYLSPEFIQKKNEDITFFTIHGILHLLGYDHKKKSDMIEMQREEKRLMKRLIKNHIYANCRPWYRLT